MAHYTPDDYGFPIPISIMSALRVLGNEDGIAEVVVPSRPLNTRDPNGLWMWDVLRLPVAQLEDKVRSHRLALAHLFSPDGVATRRTVAPVLSMDGFGPAQLPRYLRKGTRDDGVMYAQQLGDGDDEIAGEFVTAALTDSGIMDRLIDLEGVSGWTISRKVSLCDMTCVEPRLNTFVVFLVEESQRVREGIATLIPDPMAVDVLEPPELLEGVINARTAHTLQLSTAFELVGEIRG